MTDTDARLSIGLPAHPKTKKLIRRLGPAAGWSLVCLILWARMNRPDGDLTGMSGEDIELAAEWAGENDAFVRELSSVRFLDGEEGNYSLHDWDEHQPWSTGSAARSLKAKWNAIKRHHGPAEADRQVPEYAAIRADDAAKDASSKKNDASSIASSNVVAMRPASSSNAPNPSPSPNPSPTELPTSSGVATPTVGQQPALDGLTPPPDPIFGHGLAFLLAKGVKERGARSFLGAMRKEVGDMRTAELIAAAEAQDVSDPVAWLRQAAKRPGTGPPGEARRPSAADSFVGKTYQGTPIDDLPPDIRDAVRAELAATGTD